MPDYFVAGRREHTVAGSVRDRELSAAAEQSDTPDEAGGVSYDVPRPPVED